MQNGIVVRCQDGKRGSVPWFPDGYCAALAKERFLSCDRGGEA
ncbi:hypothetical protein F0726_00264 [Acidithiobacillus caldus]|nr:hypothetical protein F0726_00264 [Acidithiobacillus caldus]